MKNLIRNIKLKFNPSSVGGGALMLISNRIFPEKMRKLNIIGQEMLSFLREYEEKSSLSMDAEIITDSICHWLKSFGSFLTNSESDLEHQVIYKKTFERILYTLVPKVEEFSKTPARQEALRIFKKAVDVIYKPEISLMKNDDSFKLNINCCDDQNKIYFAVYGLETGLRMLEYPFSDMDQKYTYYEYLFKSFEDEKINVADLTHIVFGEMNDIVCIKNNKLEINTLNYASAYRITPQQRKVLCSIAMANTN